MSSNPPPLPPTRIDLQRNQRQADLGHLKLLVIFHWIFAALGVFGLFLMFGHYSFMSTFFSAILENEDLRQGEMLTPFSMFEGIAKWFYVISGLFSVLSTIANVISAVALTKRKWRMFSIIVGGVNCMSVPLGTILGVFTIVVLLRDSVCELYDKKASNDLTSE